MIVYATVGDVGATPGAEVDDDTEGMIEVASDLVRFATQNDVYAVDTNSLPTRPEIIEAFKRATIVQVISWQKMGISLTDLYAGQGTVSVTPPESSIGSGSIKRDAAAVSAKDAARVGSTKQLVPRAYKILRNVNMCSAAVGLW